MKTTRFIFNIIRVSLYFLLTGKLAEFFLRAKDGIPQIWAALTIRKEDMVRDSEFIIRMDQCQSCLVFDKKLSTCGNPWDRSKDWEDPSTGNKVPMGCFCHMETKARLKEASCWLNEETNYAHGWKRRD